MTPRSNDWTGYATRQNTWGKKVNWALKLNCCEYQVLAGWNRGYSTTGVKYLF
jgi:hypothetical protein